MIFQSDRFQADPHPGNLIAAEGGRLGLVDFGEVGSITPSERSALLGMMAAVVGRDGEALAAAVLSVSRTTRTLDSTAFGTQLTALLRSVADANLETMRLGETLGRLLHLVRTNGIILPPIWPSSSRLSSSAKQQLVSSTPPCRFSPSWLRFLQASPITFIKPQMPGDRVPGTFRHICQRLLLCTLPSNFRVDHPANERNQPKADQPKHERGSQRLSGSQSRGDEPCRKHSLGYSQATRRYIKAAGRSAGTEDENYLGPWDTGPY